MRSDSGDDAWGFLWNATVPLCQRCGSVVVLRDNGEAENGAIEDINEDDQSLFGEDDDRLEAG